MEKHHNNLNPHIKHHKFVALHGHCILPYLGKRQDLTPFVSIAHPIAQTGFAFGQLADMEDYELAEVA